MNAGACQEKWVVQPGDLWQVGPHRVLCGDSTQIENVDRVMGGERAQLIFTDPPYNLSKERLYAASVPGMQKTYAALRDADWDGNFDVATLFSALERAMGDDCSVYVCTSQWLIPKIWEWMWTWSDYCHYCVWCKPNPTPSLSKRHWTWATELIAYAVRGRWTFNFPESGHALSYWVIQKEEHRADHPTQKPTSVPLRAIQFSSRVGQVVFDGFLGSGTTLAACAQSRRVGRGIEREPKYVAVTLERLARLTGELPMKVP